MAGRRKCWCTAPLRADDSCSDPNCSPKFRAPHKRLRDEQVASRKKARAAAIDASTGFPQLEQVRERLKAISPSFAEECYARSPAGRLAFRRAKKAQGPAA